MNAPSLFERYKALTTSKSLAFPLVAEPLRPVYDQRMRVVSIPEHAAMFTASANLAHEISEFGLHGEVDGEITGEQAIEQVVHWIERAKKIMEQLP